jgi:S-adenosylmethionine/arginine decarboxylase-like enzyme
MSQDTIAKSEQQFGYKGNYGLELIMDLKGCDLSGLTQDRLTTFFIDLCVHIDMNRHGEPMYWEDHSGIPHLDGISAIQFVETSNIVCHALPILHAVYLNVFSCKEFDPESALEFCKKYWGATSDTHTVITRV